MSRLSWYLATQSQSGPGWDWGDKAIWLFFVLYKAMEIPVAASQDTSALLRKQWVAVVSRALAVGEAELRSWSSGGSWSREGTPGGAWIQPSPLKWDQHHDRGDRLRKDGCFSSLVLPWPWTYLCCSSCQKALERCTGLVGLYMLQRWSLQRAVDDLRVTPPFLRWKNLVKMHESNYIRLTPSLLSSWGRGQLLNKAPLPGPVKQVVDWWSPRSVCFACTSVLIILNCSNYRYFFSPLIWFKDQHKVHRNLLSLLAVMSVYLHLTVLPFLMSLTKLLPDVKSLVF